MWNHAEENEYDMPDIVGGDGDPVSDNLEGGGDGKDLKSAVNLCQESSTSLMTTVSSLRAQLPGKRGDASQKAGSGRQQREWGQIGPLTLQVLSEALGEQHPHLPALTNANALETCAHVTDLSLQFKGLGSLDFMWMFRVLTKLELSNNSITVIRGLEKLTRLTWLDLSFNQKELSLSDRTHKSDQLLAAAIRSTTGDACSLLEVLALHNNQLDRVDRRSLLALSKLQVLTLANNSISDIKDVRSLRVLEELASVTLAGNPMCDSRYPNFVLAHLPRLAYLDQRRVTPAAHAEAALQYKSEVSVVEAQEEKGKVKEREAAEARKSQEEHRRAGVLALNDGSLFTRMFRGDKDMGVLLQLQGIHPVMTKYRDQFNAVCMKVFNAGLAHEEQRQSELALLHDALHLAKRDADSYARG
ncbi:putative leucine-rich repeat-containing protein 48 [Penaeus vannamei]|uniref:Dynein axonemal assembly factor 1 homolog n=1 Tax=Penaeus vannamei TaxID=6689 RepID=A0A423SGR9_PENVA|nr:putative leucine-rich repeat-containing protein 48 [Penaeus vannamei]